eukprot:TRINITY_DN1971_c1_g1_i1.p1 TRINITY_DN1971_c1_g1~~TRINITY_DN1971_c1_g1_i1.p1  ORF type:complete len:787 (+),score=182.61 TRINITY_DN1971_c1_g1_i1:86-2446(+)
MSMCTVGCFAYLKALCQSWADEATERETQQADREREEFERRVFFLATVPLFRQLPRAELPKLARSLVEKQWKKGEPLCRQGVFGDTFFIIRQGKALTTVSNKAGEQEHVRAVLTAGDYFGGHTLINDRPNAATIIADDGDDAEPCVTLSLSRTSFEELGLKNKLHWPKRKAIHEDDESRSASIARLEQLDRRGPKVREYCRLLNEVPAFASLLSQERLEVATHASELVTFRPHQRILTEGKKRVAKQWYVVFSGSGCMTKKIPTPAAPPMKEPGPGEVGYVSRQGLRPVASSPAVPSTPDKERKRPARLGTKEVTYAGNEAWVKLGDLTRGAHFGERSLLRGDEAPEVNVDAGPEGMVCLTFNFEAVRPVLENVFGSSPECYNLKDDIQAWCRKKSLNFQIEPSWERQRSAMQARQIQLKDLRDICQLGRGGFGEVVLVEHEKTGKRFALKRLSKGHVVEADAGTQVSWERELLLMVDSPFIIRLYTTFLDEQFVYFLMEAALGGSLYDVICNHPYVFREDPRNGANAAFYLACIVQALSHLHERSIAYRDLKPENAMLDGDGYAKLCDMGFARFVLDKTHTLVGTPDYMAPEMIDAPHRHDMGVDWWGLGVLCYELISGQTPWDDEGHADMASRLEAIRRSQASDPHFPFHFPNSARSFVKALCEPRPHKRLGCRGGLGAQAVRDHPMFHKCGIDFDLLRDKKLPAPYVRELSERDFCDQYDSEKSNDNPWTRCPSSLFVPCEDSGDGNDMAWAEEFGMGARIRCESKALSPLSTMSEPNFLLSP